MKGLKLMLASSSALVAIAAVPAVAQTAPPQVSGQDKSVTTTPDPATAAQANPDTGGNEAGQSGVADIIITGSRISRRDFVAQSPIVTTTLAAAEASGQPNVDAYLRQLPQFQPGAGNFTSTNNGGTLGQATLNLRGLGAQRNLILMDGRRLMPANVDGTIDINSLPSNAIGSVEIISGGASATYGSDALSGVVNFKVRSDFRGLEVKGQVGIAEEGDADYQQLSAIYGAKLGDRGSAFVAVEYNRRGLVDTQDRAFTTPSAVSAFLPQGTLIANGANLPTQASVNAYFAQFGATAGQVRNTTNIGFNNNGTLFAQLAPAINYQGPTTLPFLISPTATGYNPNYFSTVQSPLERYNAFAHAEYELTDAIRLYANVNYNHSKASGRGSNPTLSAAYQLDVPITNPFIPAALRPILASRPNPLGAVPLNTRFDQAGPRAYTSKTDLYQAVLGLKGGLGFGDWTWDAYGSYGETSITDQTTGGAVSISALRRLLAAPDGGASLCAGGYNPFGINILSQSCRDYVLRFPVNHSKLRQSAGEAIFQGALFALPAGDVRAALTAGYRRNSYDFKPDASFITNDIVAISATQPTRGSIEVAEGAAEVLVPLIHDTPLIQSFNVTLGYRYSHYNTTGGVSTYKADFDWRVGKPLLLRGGYQHAVRAPNIAETFLAPTSAVTNIGLPPGAGDPCDIRSQFRTGSNGAQVRALCIATGLNPAIADSFQQPTNSIVTQSQGNRNLTPEIANSFTGGAVLQSPLGGIFSRMSLSLDYYTIKITGAISPLSAVVALPKCFNGDGSNPTYSATNYFCTLFTRAGSNGLFVDAGQPYLNLGGYKTAGVDAQLDWRIDLADVGLDGAGAFTINSVVNYLDKFQIQTLPGAAFQENAGTISTTTSYPRWKALTTLLYDIDGVQIGGRWRHIGSVADSSTVTNPASTIAGSKPYDYFDVTLRMTVKDIFEFRAGVTNVANRKPPLISGQPGLTNLGTYDAIGRSFYAGFTAKF